MCCSKNECNLYTMKTEWIKCDWKEYIQDSDFNQNTKENEMYILFYYCDYENKMFLNQKFFSR